MRSRREQTSEHAPAKRVVLLTDDELALIYAWYEVARSCSAEAELPEGVIAHDVEEEDDELALQLDRLRLKP